MRAYACVCVGACVCVCVCVCKYDSMQKLCDFLLLQSRSESSSGSSRVSPVKIVPEGRRVVRVILLNGRQVPFVVEVTLNHNRLMNYYHDASSIAAQLSLC